MTSETHALPMNSLRPQVLSLHLSASQTGWLLFILLGLPFLLLVQRLLTGGLGVNPVETLTHQTGLWALRLLLLTLAMTPLRSLTGWSWPVQVRRLIGLYTFFYACLHFTVWWLFDHQLDFTAMGRDILKRPYITLGAAALLCLLPLAITSTNSMIRRIGGKRWKQLHRLVYVIGVLVVLHFWWLVKADIREPALYGSIFLLLMLARLQWLSAIGGAWNRRLKT